MGATCLQCELLFNRVHEASTFISPMGATCLNETGLSTECTELPLYRHEVRLFNETWLSYRAHELTFISAWVSLSPMRPGPSNESAHELHLYSACGCRTCLNETWISTRVHMSSTYLICYLFVWLFDAIALSHRAPSQ
ncbi:hypothetical protein AVEN_47112-1 [Araneus ventricosus]|uniref:Uncharacterized protein n=1 Tax=Araneus ventricosus TaxID=182803 RepID=A0A4Y2LBF5_ARAVE|nr:hypothetical protein AVEN_47112-1 [Araneus ventricosus]